jgi:CRISPR-associated endoribonuclease Cas6
MYFVAMVLRLEFRNRKTMTIADGEYAHAAILHTISEADPEAGRKLHTMQRHKRMTISIVDSNARTANLRLTFMAQDGLAYANILTNTLLSHPQLRLGQTICDITAADMNDPRWAGVSTWADLVGETTSKYIHFKFVTPTAITKSNGDGGRFTSPFPLPQDIFSGLARRWQALEGPLLPDDLNEYIHSGGCIVSNYRTRANTFALRKRKQVGFTGWVLYECRHDNTSCLAALNALGQLAPFTGVGYQTMRGMGSVRVKLSD